MLWELLLSLAGALLQAANGGRRPRRRAGTSNHQPPQLHLDKGSVSGSFSRMPPTKHMRNFSAIYMDWTMLLKRTHRKIISDPALPLSGALCFQGDKWGVRHGSSADFPWNLIFSSGQNVVEWIRDKSTCVAWCCHFQSIPSKSSPSKICLFVWIEC